MNENKYFKILISVREKLKEVSDEAHKNNNLDTCDILDEIRYWLDKELGLLTEEDAQDLGLCVDDVQMDKNCEGRR